MNVEEINKLLDRLRSQKKQEEEEEISNDSEVESLKINESQISNSKARDHSEKGVENSGEKSLKYFRSINGSFSIDSDMEPTLLETKDLNERKNDLELELNEMEQIVEELKKEYDININTANDVFDQWLNLRKDTFEFMFQVTTENLILFNQEEIAHNSQINLNSKSNSDERQELWNKLQETRKIHNKLTKFLGVHEKALEELKKKREKLDEEKQDRGNEYEKELEELTDMRVASEKRIKEYRENLQNINEQIENTRKEIQLINKRIVKTQKRTERELQFLAKQLLK
jgi:DNA repair exonuclease SbcCD ATPase subunit